MMIFAIAIYVGTFSLAKQKAAAYAKNNPVKGTPILKNSPKYTHAHIPKTNVVISKLLLLTYFIR